LLGILGRCDRTLTWINLGFLFVVSLLPFSAALLAHYVQLRLAVGLYWLNLLLLGVGLEAAARYGRTALVPRDARRAPSRPGTLPPQPLSAPAPPTCLISPQASVTPPPLVQLYYIVPPRLPRTGSRQPNGGAGPASVPTWLPGGPAAVLPALSCPP